jgi:hypothetical protein
MIKTILTQQRLKPVIKSFWLFEKTEKMLKFHVDTILVQTRVSILKIN